MCGDCYDYRATVLFNAAAGELWHRFTTNLRRHLDRLKRAHHGSAHQGRTPGACASERRGAECGRLD
jgi:hypothetical protein